MSALVLPFFLAALLFPVPLQNSGGSSLKPVSKDQLCVTEGDIKTDSGTQLSVNVPKMRAFVTAPVSQEVETRFTYEGPSEGEAPLHSGQLRRQIGLKLRAQDGCNLVYAMWRLEPKAELVVSVKSNPGQHTSAQCDAHGYINIKPLKAFKIPVVKPGKGHTLRAIMERSRMRVYADNQLAWEGDLPNQALTFNGPVGIRTDNGHFEFELFAAPPKEGQTGASAGCHGKQSED